MIPLLAIAAIAYYLMTRDSMSIDPYKTGGKVLHQERMQGVLPELKNIVFLWNGPFDIVVAPDGGLRTSQEKQLAYYNSGASKAKTLAETPHGRGAAVDIWPVSFNPSLDLTQQPKAAAEFRWLRNWAVENGVELIGEWDLPHWQLPHWQSLPYPPTGNNS